MKTRGLMRGVTLVAVALLAGTGGGRMATSAEAVGERLLLDNDTVTAIEYRFPAFLSGARLFLCAHSRVINLTVTRVEQFAAVLAARGMVHTVEMDIERKGMEFAPFLASVGTTEALVERFKGRAGRVPIIAFLVDAKQPYLGAFERIFAQHGIQLVDDVERDISQAEEKGDLVRLDGEHWNVLGHRIAGEALARVLGSHIAMANRR
jgi:hypothetical protein